MHIRHRMGIGEHDVAGKHVYQRTRDDERAVVVFINFVVEFFGFCVFERLKLNGFYGRQFIERDFHSLLQLVKALAAHRGDLHRLIFSADFFLESRNLFLRAVNIAFIERDDLFELCERRRIIFQFLVDGEKILVRIAPFHAGNVHHVHQHAGAFDVF